ncbi:sulfotransferase [Temperatibacter marinus]|uniref:Sulfotransferase n=1 Tax=Temperatibacter marinus TaxID=1456591 RepID=A0AA52HA24_9PROT|nr:sulfotransferase [Temperatibacter marinus]WND03172.1 sulfotransferase [Temperatibacter marinus]
MTKDTKEAIPKHDESDRPIFIIGRHRSRSTFVQRILNSHPDTQISGEHAGILNHLAEMASAFRGDYTKETPQHRKSEEFNMAFNPLSLLFDKEDLIATTRQFITQLFKPSAACQRWGFKEIRYHDQKSLTFLLGLYPACKMLFLRRPLLEMFLSDIKVYWSNFTIKDDIELRLQIKEYIELNQLWDHVEDLLLVQHPKSCTRLEVNSLQSPQSIHDLYKILDLSTAKLEEGLIEKLLAKKIGSADSQSARRKELSDAQTEKIEKIFLQEYEKFTADE